MATTNAYEWLDGNMHRNYPILDSCSCVSASGIRLPSSFLADMDLSLPAAASALDKTRFFVSGVMRSGDSFVVEISYHGATSDILCGRSHPIPVSVRNTDDIDVTRTFGIVSVAVEDADYEALNGLSGSLIVGSCIDMQDLGNLTFPYARDGAAVSTILSVRIHTATSGIASVTVIDENDVGHTFSTDFVIQAGDGIGFTVDTDSSGMPRLNIHRQATYAEQQTPYTSIEDVETAIYAEIGQPILRINGMAPTESGDFTLTGDDCTQLEVATNGLVVKNPCAKPCCGSDTPTDIQAAVDTLQGGMDRLTAYYDSVLNMVNSMQAKLTSLIVAGRK